MAQQKVGGGCHCGRVRIQVNVDLAAGTGRCNCSICSKLRNWSVIVKPEALQLVAGEQDLSSYEWGPRISKRMFCRHCGVHVFGAGYLEQVGGDYRSVNVAVLDLEPPVLDTLPIRYFDGRNNAWMETPAYTHYL
ncbi:MAG TPA: GFA family protein [Steroidobacteraceae bacterium]|jgi:hypothetical protein|nr:GFA family protein [Steroidobacteraceae bacterium]